MTTLERVAAAILFEQEFGRDEKLREANKGWGELMIGAGSEPHSGDCTKQPWACNACLRETYLDIARAALEALKYADGHDEARLLEVSAKERVEAVSLSLAWDAMIDAILEGK